MLEWASIISLVVVVTIVIAKACDHFEWAADHLGRNFPPGIKGATINAVGSSMPELLTTMALLIIGVSGAFAAGISVTAGSAVFNSAVIPFFVILAVMAPHILRVMAFGLISISAVNKVDHIDIDKKSISRDMIALLFAELGLIYLLSKPHLDWADGLILMSLYLPYVIYMAIQSRGNRCKDNSGSENKRAWKVLLCSVAVLAFACFLLGEAILKGAVMVGVHPMISALFLGAAVSSVPDTILSVKDAIKGNYEDALGNALGSNTFDICIALGLPLFLYTAITGPIQMPDHDAVQVLRVGLLGFTALIACILLLPRMIRLWQAKALIFVYIVWAAFALNTEFLWI